MRYFILLHGQWAEVFENHGTTLRYQRPHESEPEAFDGRTYRIHSGEDVVLYTPQGTIPVQRMVDTIAYLINSKQPIPRA